ncbi:MAG: zf-HC2 domain-containing protein [Lachnospiraceae bacterium]|nr:zf-HC2 domain-containing protein [Lachnospiraceae bacterium]
MKLNCNVIRDLLPLYADQICSGESRELVDEHLAECGDCSALLRQMRSTEIEIGLKSETENVLRRQASFFKRKSAAIGAIIAGIFMIPVLVCLIVNLASGAALDWFFIVLASLITAASLIVVPLMVPENKFLWTLGTFTASLLLLLGVICIYTQGRWFFMVSSAVLLGFSVCFLPFAVYTKPLRTLLGHQKGLTVMCSATMLFGLMMLCIGLYTKSPAFWRIAPAISLPILVFMWFLFLFVRYAKLGRLLKAGICTAIVGVFSFFADCLINKWLGIVKPLPVFRPFVWKASTIDGNVKWLLLLGCSLVGIILIVFGVCRSAKEKR